MNNPRFGNCVDFIYPSELEIKDTADSPVSASYLDIMLEIDQDQHLTTNIYDKRDDFDFSISNFPSLCNNIPGSPAYGVFISQLKRYFRACSGYLDFHLRGKLLTLRHGYKSYKLRNAFRKLYGKHHKLTDEYSMPVLQIITVCSWSNT